MKVAVVFTMEGCPFCEMIKEEFENDFKNLLMLKFQKRFLTGCQKKFKNS